MSTTQAVYLRQKRRSIGSLVVYVGAFAFLTAHWLNGGKLLVLGYDFPVLPLVCAAAVPAIVSVLQFHPAFRTLKIDEEGFSYRNTLGGLHVYQWTEIERFGTYALGRTTVVVFKLGSESRRKTKVSEALGGFDRLLPDTWGMTAEELLGLLEKHHGRKKG